MTTESRREHFFTALRLRKAPAKEGKHSVWLGLTLEINVMLIVL